MHDDGPALGLAFSRAFSTGQTLLLPEGTILLKSMPPSGNYWVVANSGSPNIRGMGEGATVITVDPAIAGLVGGFNFTNTNGWSVSDLSFELNYVNPGPQGAPGVVEPLGLHCIRVGATTSNSNWIIERVGCRHSPGYGFGLEGVGAYVNFTIRHVDVAFTRRDSIDSKNNTSTNTSGLIEDARLTSPSLRSGRDACIDVRGVINLVNDYCSFDPSVAATGFRSRSDSSGGGVVGPIGLHGYGARWSNWSGLFVDVGGQTTSTIGNYSGGDGRRAIDLEDPYTSLTGFTILNGWSDTTAQGTNGPTGLFIGQFAFSVYVTNGRILDQAVPILICGPGNVISSVDVEGGTGAVPNWTANPANRGVEFSYDPTNPTPGLACNASNNILSDVTIGGYAVNYHAVTGVTGNIVRWSRSARAGVNDAVANGGFAAFESPTLGVATTLSQGSATGVPGLTIANNPVATSGVQISGTAGDPRFTCSSSVSADCGIDIVGKGKTTLLAKNSDSTTSINAGLSSGGLPAISFLGGAACTRQTVAAALPTDGSATAAQLAAAANALRAAMICFGLAQ